MKLSKVCLALILALSASALKVSNKSAAASLASADASLQSMAEVGKTKVTTGSSTKKDDDPYGIGEFCLGCVLIPFALVFLWKNEKKLVTYAKCMETAKEDCTSVSADSADQGNNFKLVHVTGKTENKTDLVDNDFGVTAENSYRLIRSVEMYQW